MLKSVRAMVSTHWQFLLVLGIVLVCAMPILLYPMGRDQGMYANIGRTILQGGVPFRDMWDIKPPPIYYIYATGIALFGETTSAIRMIDLVLIPLAMLGLYLIGCKLDHPYTGILSALIFACLYFSDQFANLTQNDGLVTVPMIWAVWCALNALSSSGRNRWVWAMLTGGLCGLTLWFKHYQVFFVVALVVHHLWLRIENKTALRQIITEALAFSVGGLLVGGSMLVYFWSLGMVQEMLIVAQGTSAYNAQFTDWGAFLSQMGNYLMFRWQYWGAGMLLGGLWVLVCIKQWRAWRMVILWFLAGLAFMMIQRLGFDTHWMPMLPALALFAAGATVKLSIWLPQRATLLLVGGVFIAILTYNIWLPALPYLQGQETQEQYFARFQANDLKPAESLAVVNYLQDKLARGDSIFIWGFRPEVAFMGGWRPATRYQAQFPLVATWYPAEWKQDNVDQLWAAMPPIVLLMQDDFMSWVTGHDADSHTILQGETELNNWLMANYERIDTQGDFIIWQHKPR
jgi:4-amino-4-deoxy-L-arabinose transferase-like glycosyltransferase